MKKIFSGIATVSFKTMGNNLLRSNLTDREKSEIFFNSSCF